MKSVIFNNKKGHKMNKSKKITKQSGFSAIELML
jgi:hypothetical protein